MSQPFAEALIAHNLLGPAADAAGRTGDWISCKHAQRVLIVATVKQGNAAQVTFTLRQASAVAGTGEKALSGDVRIKRSLNTLTDVPAPVADGTALQLDAALADKLVVFEIDPATALDLANGFDCLTVATSASNVANITSAVALIMPRYAENTPVSVFTD